MPVDMLKRGTFSVDPAFLRLGLGLGLGFGFGFVCGPASSLGR